MGVVDSLVIGRDGIVRGANVRAITKGKPVHLSRLVQKLYPLEFLSEGKGSPTNSVCKRSKETPTRNVPRRNAALDARWKSQLMVDS